MYKIAILNYGVSNLYSVYHAVSKIAPKFEVKITNDIKYLKSADKIIFPGQGSMISVMNFFKKKDILYEIFNIINNKISLCICIGMQLLFTYSEENFSLGLGIIPGRILKFNYKDNIKIPHIGWNQIFFKNDNVLLKNIKSGSNFYFVHSFYLKPIINNIILAKTIYKNINIPSIILYKNILATQFHPEKSSKQGLQLYKNFIFWKP